MARIRTLAETGFFQKSLKDKTVFKYMRIFYKNVLKPGRAKPFTLKRMTLYTCQYIFPPTRGYPNGRPCVDDVYGLPDPDCPACGGCGHPIKSDKYKAIRIMGLFVPFGDEELLPMLVGNVPKEDEKLLVGLPVPPEYTNKYGLLPKTNVLDAQGNIIEQDVHIGFKLEVDDVVIKEEPFWDGNVNTVNSIEYVVAKVQQNDLAISYHRMFQIYHLKVINVSNKTLPMPRQHI